MEAAGRSFREQLGALQLTEAADGVQARGRTDPRRCPPRVGRGGAGRAPGRGRESARSTRRRVGRGHVAPTRRHRPTSRDLDFHGRTGWRGPAPCFSRAPQRSLRSCSSGAWASDPGKRKTSLRRLDRSWSGGRDRGDRDAAVRQRNRSRDWRRSSRHRGDGSGCALQIAAAQNAFDGARVDGRSALLQLERHAASMRQFADAVVARERGDWLTASWRCSDRLDRGGARPSSPRSSRTEDG